MVTEFPLLSILLVCFLIELDCCSAFPRARRSTYSIGWPGVREEQDEYGFGNGHFVPSSHSNTKIQSNDHVYREPRPWQHPWAHSDQAQIQSQPNLDHQTQRLNQPWLPHSFQSQSEVPVPKGFQFNFQIPMVDAKGQSKENISNTRGSSSNRGESDHASYNLRPGSVQIQSSFNSPSVLNHLLGHTSGKKPHDVSKPSFGLTLSLPLSPTTTPSKPSTSSVQNRIPERGHFVENSNAKPESVHTDHKVITFSPDRTTKPAPTEHFSQDEISPEHIWVFPDQMQYPALPLQSWQPESIFSGYYSDQINPTMYHYWRDRSAQTVSASPNNAHSLAPNVLLSRPSGPNYAQYQICHLDGSPLTIAEQYGLLMPTYEWHKVPVPAQRPGPHSSTPFSHQNQPSFEHRTVSGSANYQMGQDSFYSPYPYSLDQSGQNANPRTRFDSYQTLHGPSKYEAQVEKQVAGYPFYHGQYNYFY
ncbi:hypothetical protein Q5P01_012026 [Channa striata]|uniref:Uncharacterized protein n=1 Tax=Channa striata TaxID=64152 RepID=A0AA88MMW5_CHASR|nr:hypothetical protein Q5P01_012026 [Channa striata]